MNPQPKLYHLIDIEGEKKLREVNPYDKRQTIVDDNFLTDYPYNHFEQSAIANAKALVNPVPGKVEYSSDELRDVWQWYHVIFEKWINAFDDEMNFTTFDDFKENHKIAGIDTRPAFEYIGEKVEEIEISEIQQVKNDNYLLTIKVDQLERELKAERSRIIGLIESEKLAIEKCLENMNRSNEFRNSCHTELSVLNKLLTLMKQDGKQQ